MSKDVVGGRAPGRKAEVDGGIVNAAAPAAARRRATTPNMLDLAQLLARGRALLLVIRCVGKKVANEPPKDVLSAAIREMAAKLVCLAKNTTSRTASASMERTGDDGCTEVMAQCDFFFAMQSSKLLYGRLILETPRRRTYVMRKLFSKIPIYSLHRLRLLGRDAERMSRCVETPFAKSCESGRIRFTKFDRAARLIECWPRYFGTWISRWSVP